MSGETPNKNNQSPAVTEWDSLKKYDVVEQNLQDDLLNIDDMLKSGRITEEKADEYRAEINAKLEKAKEPHLDPSSQKYFDDENLNIDFMLKSGSITEEQADRFREEVKQRAQQSAADDLELQKKLQQMEQRGEEDEFAGERNINDATGKERTRGLFDLYPQEKGESREEYIKRLHRMRELREQAEKEKVSALEHEKEAVLANEKDKTNAKAAERISPEEAERRVAQYKEIAESVANEAERRKAAYQKILERVESLQGNEEEDDENSLEKKLANLENKRNELAELYAKNRRLFVGKEKREQFKAAKAEYGKLLDECLRMQAKETFETGERELANRLKEKFDTLEESINSQLVEFAGGDLDNTDKTDEEIETERARLLKIANDALDLEWKEGSEQLKAKVNAEFLEDFLKQANALEEETVDRIDNGTILRKAVSKILANKNLKTVLIVAGIAGLAITGVGLGMGLAAGTASVGYSLTLGGAAAGAGRGALAGLVMSRQDSKNSAVRTFSSEEDIKNQLKDINILDENSDTANVADWLVNQYETAKDTDQASNRKRTAISAGLGAAFGAILSGVQIDHVSNQIQTENEQIGTTPLEHQYQAANLDQINIPEGHGISTTFQQLGGNLNDPAAFDRFTEIVHSVGDKYGLVPGDNGIVGSFAHTYPGTIDTWPVDAQAYITEVANEAARQGLVPSNTVVTGGGEAIYGPVTRIAQEIVPDAFMNFFAQATATTGVAVGAGALAGRPNRMPTAETPQNPGPETPPETPEAPTPIEEPTPETPEKPEVPEPTEPETPPEASTESETPQEEAEQPAPEETEATPNPQEQELDRNYRYMVANELRNLAANEPSIFFSEEDIDVITMENAPGGSAEQNAINDRVQDWWDNLDDRRRNIVLQYEERHNRPTIYGSALRGYLQSANILGNPSTTTPEEENPTA